MIREKAEDFIGWKSEDGNLEVIGIIEKGKHTKFKVTCKICSPDTELFPLGYFISTKTQLKDGKKPCGCSKSNWVENQYITFANRVGQEKDFNVEGVVGDFCGHKTKLKLKCNKDDHVWTTSVSSIINGRKTGCPKCSGNMRLTEQEALSKCNLICKEMDYITVGFSGGYKNCYSDFEYLCPIHGIKKTTYSNFVYHGKRCPDCSDYGYKTSKSGAFYIVRWSKDSNTEEKNNKSFIKFGITNRNIEDRLSQQKSKTNYNYEIIKHFTWKDGNIAKQIERLVKNDKNLTRFHMEKYEFEDGYTETLDEKHLNILIDLVDSAIKAI